LNHPLTSECVIDLKMVRPFQPSLHCFRKALKW
jgi:hypothetical protein